MCRWPSTWNAGETCAKAGGPAQALYAERIAQAEEWTQRNVGFAPSLPQAANEGLFAGLANAGADGDRRSLFTDMLSQLKDAASGTTRERTDARLQTLREQNERFAAHQRLDLGNGTQFNKFASHGARQAGHGFVAQPAAASARHPARHGGAGGAFPA